MNVKDLIFFNKEGLSINTIFDDAANLHRGKVFTDPNSPDTFKTLGVYVFESVSPVSLSGLSNLTKYQYYSEDRIYSVRGGYSSPITSIRLTAETSSYSTKCVTVDDASGFSAGDIIYFKGLGGDFPERDGSNNLIVYQILSIIGNDLLIQVGQTNDNAINLPSILFSNDTAVVSVNAVVNTVPAEMWNESTYSSGNYIGKKMTSVGNTTEVFTVSDLATRLKTPVHSIDTSGLTLSSGGFLNIEITNNKDKILVESGEVIFNSANSTLTFSDPIPAYLAIGNVIQAKEKNPNSNALNALNKVLLTITDIDKPNKKIKVSQTLFTQTVDCKICLSGDAIIMSSDNISDVNNSESAFLSLASLLYSNENVLSELGLETQIAGETINIIESDYSTPGHASFYDIAINIADSNNNITSTVNSTVTYKDNYVIIADKLITDNDNRIKSNVYNRLLYFASIDSDGLELVINGTSYQTDKDVDVENTLLNFYIEHNSALEKYGITITPIAISGNSVDPKNSLHIEFDYPEINYDISVNVGTLTDWGSVVCSVTPNHIDTALTITVDGIAYTQTYNTSTTVTSQSWINNNEYNLKLRGIKCYYGVNGDILLTVKDVNSIPDVSINVGVTPKYGEEPMLYDRTDYANNGVFALLAGNELSYTGNDFISNGFATGQSITLTGSQKAPQNRGYNIIGILDDTLMLSYTGPYWNYAGVNTAIESAAFIRKPRRGISLDDKSKLIVEITDSTTDQSEIFLYDYSGEQLKNTQPVSLRYTGVTPLYDAGQVLLNKKPNTDITKISDPSVQQTVFSKLVFDLPYIDDPDDIDVEPNPLEFFAAHNSQNEGYSKSTITAYLLDPNGITLDSDPITGDDEVYMSSEGYIELRNSSADFLASSFVPGQYIMVTSQDSTGDGSNLWLRNNGSIYRVTDVKNKKLFVELISGTLYDESSIKTTQKLQPPFIDVNGDAILQTRGLSVSITAHKTPILVLQVMSSTVVEDTRLAVRLANVGKNILPDDVYMLLEHSTDEDALDVFLLNRKRKEFFDVYSDIYNNPATYKALDTALKFWGYGDLNVVEYLVNFDIESPRFGKEYRSDLLTLYDKSSDKFLNKKKYKKTGKFSLTYNITDEAGNFLTSVSRDVVYNKLHRLKRWLTDNVTGSAILSDISGVLKSTNNETVNHHSNLMKGYVHNDFVYPLTLNANGYLSPVAPASNNYDIEISFSYSKALPDDFSVNITTFNVETWISSKVYKENDEVFYVGQIFKCKANCYGIEPGSQIGNSYWSIVEDWSLNPVQVYDVYKTDDTPINITINKTTDPHIRATVISDNGYGGTFMDVKTWSVDYGQWPTT